MSQDQDPWNEWALPIGRFMMKMGEAEFWVNHIIGQLGGQADRASRVGHRLSDRISHLRHLVSEGQPASQLQDQMTAALRTIERLARTRNLIAHHAPMGEIWSGPRRDEPLVVIQFRGTQRPDVTLSLSDLELQVDEARAVVGSLHELSTRAGALHRS